MFEEKGSEKLFRRGYYISHEPKWVEKKGYILISEDKFDNVTDLVEKVLVGCRVSIDDSARGVHLYKGGIIMAGEAGYIDFIHNTKKGLDRMLREFEMPLKQPKKSKTKKI